MFLGFKLVLLYPQWNPGYDTISMKYYTFTHTYTYMYGAGELFMIKYEKKKQNYICTVITMIFILWLKFLKIHVKQN